MISQPCWGTDGPNVLFGTSDREELGDEYDSIEAIQGSKFDDGIFGGDGDDLIIGGAGNDVFIFHSEFNNDHISGFEGGENASDQIHIKDEFVTNFEDVLEALTANGTDVVLTLEGGSITFENMTIDQLAADDFIFG